MNVQKVVILQKSVPALDLVAAQVEAAARDLMGRRRNIEMCEMKTNDRVSYLTVFEHAPRKMLTFETQAIPIGTKKPIKLTYRDQLAV